MWRSLDKGNYGAALVTYVCLHSMCNIWACRDITRKSGFRCNFSKTKKWCRLLSVTLNMVLRHIKVLKFQFLCPRHDNGWGIKCYAPAMTIAGALSVTPFCPYVCLSVRMYICHTNNICSLSWIVLIGILWNLVTLYNTKMSSSSSIMVHIAPCFRELSTFVHENSAFLMVLSTRYCS